MRDYLKLTACIIFIFPTLALAALPPGAESLRRIKTVAESPAVFDKVGSADYVTGITQTKEGYVVTTNRCKLYVSIHETNLKDIDPGMIGPPKLDVVIGEMKCQKRR